MRLSSWDYSWDGSYFITICTQNRRCIFGNVINSQIKLSPIGDIVIEEWFKSFDIRNELFCDAFVIMPNHLHAIVRIDNNRIDSLRSSKPEKHPAGTHSRATEGMEKNKHGVAYRPPKSISSFVAGFKSASTKRINKLRNSPEEKVWQARFHDHIIRSEEDYQRIFEYIKYNPQKWEEDKYHISL